MTRLTGQVAVVTGASSGIGRAIAEAFAAAGAKVVVNHPPSANSRSKAADVVDRIAAQGGTARAVAADVSKEGDVQALVAETIAQFGDLHIMVANAGIERTVRFAEMSLDQWRSVIDVNLTGAFLCAREAVRHFLKRDATREAGAIGKIVFTSSVHEVIPWAFQANYAASKGGINMLMKSLAQEVAPMRIRVNAVAPGAIKTPINKEAWQTAEAAANLMRLIPYGRIGEPMDVARAVAWLVSDEADYVTGTTLFVDGGMTLYPEFRGRG
ncbi:MAG: glucose 1-dehydrogenase [Alphaproteobacteria bacterium]|nr:glucose 1-dehydrogenase [Alphaproteobacteria bacterium]